MEDDAKEMMGESLEDSLDLMEAMAKQTSRGYSEEDFMNVAIALYKERMMRKNQEWMHKQMQGAPPREPSDKGRY